MSLSRQEIIDYAARYVALQEIVDFPEKGELFSLLDRDLPGGKILAEEEGWRFQGYGICLDYTIDEDAKPVGKWLWMHFASLASFPPSAQVFRLQPPHIAKGRFQNPARTVEFRILKVSLARAEAAPSEHAENDPHPKIVKFRTRKKPS
ncbi:MAG: hypothetical protein MUF22_09175 [Chitinispirillaceae bacterium]|jgi:hypothetical protein|nr:hypothetical protein [Chitinispirillaceae bacterium]